MPPSTTSLFPDINVWVALTYEGHSHHSNAAEWFATQGMDPVTAALSGGDDYELLFAVPAKLRGPLKAVRAAIGGLPLTRIGELTRDRNVLLSRAGQTTEMPAGFEHFRT